MNDTTEDGQFSTPSDILQVVTTIENSLLPRSNDRALMDVQFNGGRPFTAEEEKEFQIQCNSNFLEGFKIAQSGILQVNSALLDKERFANFRCLKGNPNKRAEWGEQLTNNIHKALKEGRSGKRYAYRLDDRNTQLVGHGVGPLWWSNKYNWMPKSVGMVSRVLKLRQRRVIAVTLRRRQWAGFRLDDSGHAGVSFPF